MSPSSSEREFFASRVEAMARWLYEQEGESDLSEYPPRMLGWDELSDASRVEYRADASAALKAVDGEETP
jgi:hypothetical protein